MTFRGSSEDLQIEVDTTAPSRKEHVEMMHRKRRKAERQESWSTPDSVRLVQVRDRDPNTGSASLLRTSPVCVCAADRLIPRWARGRLFPTG